MEDVVVPTRSAQNPSSPGAMAPGMMFAYEQPITNIQEALGQRPRVLALKFLSNSGSDGTRLMFDVLGLIEGDGAWGSGHLFLDALTVEESLGSTLRRMP